MDAYSVAIRTLGQAGAKYQLLLDSLLSQTIKPTAIYVYIAEGYSLPKETIGVEKYVYVKKGMVSQRTLLYEEISTKYILFLDDDVYLPDDAVEKMLNALISHKANVISPDVFHNSERSVCGKLLMAIPGRMWPRRDDKVWAYKVMRNSGYSYNSSPSQDIYLSQTNAGPCFLCSKSDFLNLHFEDELWLEKCAYSQGDDQVMFYKMYCLGYKQLTLFNSGIIHLDAGTTLRSEDKQRKMIFSDLRFKTIFWHRYIFLPEKRIYVRLWSCMCILYTFIFSLLSSLFRLNLTVFHLKCNAILSGINSVKSAEYRNLPKITKAI